MGKEETAYKCGRSFGNRHFPVSQFDIRDDLIETEDSLWEVQLTIVSPQGKEATIGVLGPETFFGEGCLACQPFQITTATVQPLLAHLALRHK